MTESNESNKSSESNKSNDMECYGGCGATRIKTPLNKEPKFWCPVCLLAYKAYLGSEIKPTKYQPLQVENPAMYYESKKLELGFRLMGIGPECHDAEDIRDQFFKVKEDL